MSARRDVLFYAPNAGPLLRPNGDLPPGGAETQLVLIARELARRGVRVAFAVYGDDAPVSLDGIDIMPVPRAARSAAPGLRVIALLGSVVRAVRDAGAPVVVQSNAGVTTAYVAVAARVTGRRFIYRSANVADFELARMEPRRHRIAGFRLGIALAHLLVVQTEEQARLARARFRRPTARVSSVAEPATPRRPDPSSFLWIGRLARYKRPEAYLELARSLPDARFRMVGVPLDAEGSRIRAEIAEHAAAVPNLELLDPRPRAQLAALYEDAVAVVNTAEFEGMPNIFLEGWAHGVPALALTHDPDGVIERERLGAFARGDRTQLTEYARAMWQERADQEELSRRCVAYVKRNHAIAAVAERWAELIASNG